MGDRKNIKPIKLHGEIWVDIAGFEGLYAVSNKLRVKSFKRISSAGFTINEKILRPGKHKHGYARYTLCKNDVLHYVNRHRLIAQAFIPNPLNLPCVNHIDNDPTNDNISNLEWCTFSHNTRHAYKTKRLDRSGSKNSMSKLTEAQVKYIFNFIGDKRELEIKYKISRQAINDIKSGRRWGHITGKKHPSVKKRLCEG